MDEQPGPAAQQRQVARADPPARSGEQPYEGGVGARVLEDLADRDQVGDLGEMEQSGEADDLDGDVPGDQRALDLGEVAGRTAQDRDLAGLLARTHQMGERVGEPLDLLGVGGQEGDADDAVALGAGGDRLGRKKLFLGQPRAVPGGDGRYRA